MHSKAILAMCLCVCEYRERTLSNSGNKGVQFLKRRTLPSPANWITAANSTKASQLRTKTKMDLELQSQLHDCNDKMGHNSNYDCQFASDVTTVFEFCLIFSFFWTNKLLTNNHTEYIYIYIYIFRGYRILCSFGIENYTDYIYICLERFDIINLLAESNYYFWKETNLTLHCLNSFFRRFSGHSLR